MNLEEICKLQAEKIEYLHSRVQYLEQKDAKKKERMDAYNKRTYHERKIKQILKNQTK
jgi:hypothetical protein